MKKVLFVATVPGTIRGFLLPFAEHFRWNGWIVDGAAKEINQCESCSYSLNNVWNIDWSRNPLDINNFLNAARQVREVVTREQYDLVHVHTPVASFITRFSLRNLSGSIRPSVIYTAHGFHFHSHGSFLKNTYFRTLEKIAGNWTDFLVVMNKEDFDVAKRYRIVPEDRLHYMPGIGVDTAVKLPECNTSQLRNELKLPADSCVFLVVAEFIPRKRHADVIQALLRLNDENIHLVFAGRGPLREQLEVEVANLHLDKQVHFLGHRKDINSLILQANAMILPSLHEGLPRSLMEALCLSSPCIGSDIRGTRDLLEGGCGLLYKVRDVKGLANAMRWVQENPEAAKRMGEFGKKRMETHDIKEIIKLHDSLYSMALDSKLNNYSVQLKQDYV